MCNYTLKNVVWGPVGADWGITPGPSLELPLVGGIAPMLLGDRRPQKNNANCI